MPHAKLHGPNLPQQLRVHELVVSYDKALPCRRKASCPESQGKIYNTFKNSKVVQSSVAQWLT